MLNTFWLFLNGCTDQSKTNNIDTSNMEVDSGQSTDDIVIFPPGEDALAQEALIALRDVSVTPVSISPGAGAPAFVHAIIPIGNGHPIDEATSVLQTYASLFGIADISTELHPSISQNTDDIELVHFRQVIPSSRGDIPIFNAGVSVHLSDTHVWGMSSRILRDLNPQPPKITAEEALELAEFTPNIRILEKKGEARLGIWVKWNETTRQGQPYTVWRWTINGAVVNTGEEVLWQVDFDAITGEVRNVENQVLSVEKDFDIMYGNHDSSSSCWFFVDTEDWFDEDGQLSEYSSITDHNNDGMETWLSANTTWDWYWNNLGWLSWDNDNVQLEIITHVANFSGLAAADDYCGQIIIQDDYAALDVIAHEFTHLVDSASLDLNYRGQSGALDESFADIFACLIDGNWTMGESIGEYIRNVANPPEKFDPLDVGDPDHMLAELSGDGIGFRYISGEPNKNNDFGWVHTNSGIPNKAMYLITEGGSHNGLIINGIGPTRARQLFHVVHTGVLGGDATFTDARNAMIQAANFYAMYNMHDFEPQHVCAVLNAWASVGIATETATDLDCDGISDSVDQDDDGDGVLDTEDNCPQIPNVAQHDIDGDGFGNDCDDDMDGDTILNENDNCPKVPNSDQTNNDGDLLGDACDDNDHDGIADAFDNCPSESNWNQADFDGDGLGDACDPDIDGDSIANENDNCPSLATTDLSDRDGDGLGDPCDNCPAESNPDQADCDHDGIGTVCDDGLDAIYCNDFSFVEETVFVHPLDLVALPHVREEGEPFLDSQYRLKLTLSNTTDPWMVVDNTGRVVAKSQETATSSRIREATWKPTLEYHFTRSDGSRAPFATTYSLIYSPNASSNTSAIMKLEGFYQ